MGRRPRAVFTHRGHATCAHSPAAAARVRGEASPDASPGGSFIWDLRLQNGEKNDSCGLSPSLRHPVRLRPTEQTEAPSHFPVPSRDLGLTLIRVDLVWRAAPGLRLQQGHARRSRGVVPVGPSSACDASTCQGRPT